MVLIWSCKAQELKTRSQNIPHMYVQPMDTVTWYLNERPNCKANNLH